MPVEYRQGPIYFHAVRSNKFRKNYDEIFRKKKEVKTPQEQPSITENKQDTTTKPEDKT